jgi:hypothetical protein
MRALNPQPPRNQRSRPFLELEAQGEPLALTDEVLWPHPTWVARARWAAQTVERYLHVARIIRSPAAALARGRGTLSTGSPRPRALQNHADVGPLLPRRLRLGGERHGGEAAGQGGPTSRARAVAA